MLRHPLHVTRQKLFQVNSRQNHPVTSSTRTSTVCTIGKTKTPEPFTAKILGPFAKAVSPHWHIMHGHHLQASFMQPGNVWLKKDFKSFNNISKLNKIKYFHKNTLE